MRNWSEHEESYCSGQDDMESIDKVCKHLGIDWRVVDFQKEYWNAVFQPSLDEFEAGSTPNPDVLCNREIKFKKMEEYIFEKYPGVDYLATGHYARIRPSVRTLAAEHVT
jgi:tRNA-specific 2-thiouridylase